MSAQAPIIRGIKLLVVISAALPATFFVIVGFYEMFLGVYIYLSSGNLERTIELSLKGLELLFLSPLSYITVMSLMRYVPLFKEPPPNETPDDRHAREVEMHAAHAQLTHAKAMVVSLMAAVVGTDLVSQILRVSKTIDAASFTLEFAKAEAVIVGAEAIGLIVLISFFWVLERSHHQTGDKSATRAVFNDS